MRFVPGGSQASGRASFREFRRERAISTTSSPIATIIESKKPTRLLSGARCRPRQPRWSTTWTTFGETRSGWGGGASATASPAPSPSTKCTWAPGCAFPKRSIVRWAIARLRPNWPRTSSAWVSPTWNSCPSWSIRFTAPGATRRPGTSLPPAAMGLPRTSCTSSTISTSAALACCSTGCRPISRATSTDSATSTERTSTSTRTRARVSTRSGKAASSTTAATRSEAS